MVETPERPERNMHKFAGHIVFTLFLLTSGCSKESAAAASGARRPQQPGGVPYAYTVTDAATGMPGGGLAVERDSIQIVIEEMNPLKADGGILGGLVPFSVKVKVTSTRATRPLVEPRRFYIRFAGSEAVAVGRPATDQKPALPSVYLKNGTYAGGWVTFEIPRGSKEILLCSDLAYPPFEIPITPRVE
jgi:hypothetical protein